MILGFAIALGIAIGMVVGALVFGVLAGVPSAHWISQRITNFLMFTPTERFAKPLPEMGRAATLALHGKVKEAAGLYEEFLVDHAEMKEIHLCLVELAYGPLQDEEYGVEILARAERDLVYESDRDGVRQHAAMIQKGELLPLKHLGWCDLSKGDHSGVEVPELIKGRILPQPESA